MLMIELKREDPLEPLGFTVAGYRTADSRCQVNIVIFIVCHVSFYLQSGWDEPSTLIHQVSSWFLYVMYKDWLQSLKVLKEEGLKSRWTCLKSGVQKGGLAPVSRAIRSKSTSKPLSQGKLTPKSELKSLEQYLKVVFMLIIFFVLIGNLVSLFGIFHPLAVQQEMVDLK